MCKQVSAPHSDQDKTHLMFVQSLDESFEFGQVSADADGPRVEVARRLKRSCDPAFVGSGLVSGMRFDPLNETQIFRRQLQGPGLTRHSLDFLDQANRFFLGRHETIVRRRGRLLVAQRLDRIELRGANGGP